MAYITYDQFVALYGTAPITEEAFPTYAQAASDLIDSITMYRIQEAGGVAALPPLVQTLVEKAAAAQVVYFAENGLEATMSGQIGTGFTVGKVRVDNGAGQSGMTAAQMMVSPAVRALLEQTGLMGRSALCFDRYRHSYFMIP